MAEREYRDVTMTFKLLIPSDQDIVDRQINLDAPLVGEFPPRNPGESDRDFLIRCMPGMLEEVLIESAGDDIDEGLKSIKDVTVIWGDEVRRLRDQVIDLGGA